MELEIMLGGMPRLMRLLVLWQSDDGSVAVAVPSCAVASGAEFQIGTVVGGCDAPLPPGTKLGLRYVQLSSEMMARAGPYSSAAAS